MGGWVFSLHPVGTGAVFADCGVLYFVLRVCMGVLRCLGLESFQIYVGPGRASHHSEPAKTKVLSQPCFQKSNCFEKTRSRSSNNTSIHTVLPFLLWHLGEEAGTGLPGTPLRSHLGPARPVC